jgi:hypothetical protein
VQFCKSNSSSLQLQVGKNPKVALFGSFGTSDSDIMILVYKGILPADRGGPRKKT